MRLAYVDPQAFPSPAPESLQVFHTCAGLAHHAERVWLVGGKSRLADAPAFYGMAQPPNLVLRRLPRFRRTHGWIRPSWTAPFHLLALATLRRLARGGLHAVLVRNLKLGQFLLHAHRRRPLPPVVFESHQLFAETLEEEAAREGRAVPKKVALLAAREAEVYREAAGIVVLTHGMAAALRERFATRGKLLVAPDGVDRAAALPAPRDPHGPITYLGNFHWWKGVEVLVEAMALLPAERLMLVGGEPEARARMAALAASRGVPERVRLAGQVAPAERWRYLAEASICALPLIPSPYQACTSPLKLFEYMAAARPIVASDLPALREVLRDGENGLLVRPGDPASLAAAVQRLRSDPRLADRLAQQAASDVGAYTWEARGKALVAFLDGVRAD